MDALLVVDFQNDFTPGGALPVNEGDEIGEPINALADCFDLVVATRDWHPRDHGSFEGAEADPEKWEGTDPPGIWPVHCVQGSVGAELHPSLDQTKIDLIVDKGQDRNSQGYSGFHGNNLAELLRERGVDHIYLAGLTTDYCVKYTALDALREFAVTVVEDATRAVNVNPGDGMRALDEVKKAGAKLASSKEVLETVAR